MHEYLKKRSDYEGITPLTYLWRQASVLPAFFIMSRAKHKETCLGKTAQFHVNENFQFFSKVLPTFYATESWTFVEFFSKVIFLFLVQVHTYESSDLILIISVTKTHFSQMNLERSKTQNRKFLISSYQTEVRTIIGQQLKILTIILFVLCLMYSSKCEKERAHTFWIFSSGLW